MASANFRYSAFVPVSYTHLDVYKRQGRYLRRVFPAYGVRFIAITDSIDTAHDSGDDLTLSLIHI